MSLSNGILSPIAYNAYLPSPDVGVVSRYSQANLLVGDAYKEQQFWLSVYNRAQQFGMKGASVAEILTQLKRVSEKLNTLQNTVLPAAESWFKSENETNQKIPSLFQTNS